METQLHQNNGSGNWIAFLFGAIFNTLATFEIPYMTDYAVKACIGGFICLLFKMLGDVLNLALKDWWMKAKGLFERKKRRR